MNNTSIDGILYAEMIRGGAARLRKNKEIVNDLNVFPVPDGDTGNNMLMTLEGGLNALTANEKSIGKTAKDLSNGLLLGARGNSGVILSQFFGGINKVFENYDCVGTQELSSAFEEGVRQAYASVITPAEGTILTVAREASAKAAACGDKKNTDTFFGTFINEAKESLKRTPDLLPCLKEAGVVDSGGAGLVYIFEGMQSVLKGEKPEETKEQAAADPRFAPSPAYDFGPDSRMKFGYCTEFILQLMNYKTDPERFDVSCLVDYLNTIGDSIVAVKSGSLVKAHVHTMTPGRVFEFCQQFGEFVTLKVENMTIQHSETVITDRHSVSPTAEPDKSKEKKKHAIVAVVNGAGLAEAFTSFGCDAIIEGGQTMNPSTNDFIEAFRKINAENIYVLPNNSNIIMAASQAAEMYKDASVRVIQTSTVAQGYVAMTMLDLDSDDPDIIAGILCDAAKSVISAQVSYAVRDADYDDLSVKKGDYIGFSQKKVLSKGKTPGEAACALIDRIDKAGKEVLIALCGKECGKEDLELLEKHINREYKELEFFSLDGGQDIYSFIFALE